jgi:hypothetical protein
VNTVTLDELTAEVFRPHLNDAFQMRSGPDTLDVVLIAVDNLRPRPAGTRQPFSLVFRGPMTPVWAQHIYRLSHAALGEFDIFFVPIGPDDMGLQYEAVFG